MSLEPTEPKHQDQEELNKSQLEAVAWRELGKRIFSQALSGKLTPKTQK